MDVTVGAATILLEPERLLIPAGFPDLASFRAWARSDSFPQRGRIDYVAGEVHVDMSPEDLVTHGSLKTALAYRLHGIVVEELDAGVVFTDRARLSSPAARLSVEPDVVVLLDASLRAGRARLVPKAGGREGRYVEIEGAADLVVECVSDASVGKDARSLLALYARAGVREYWLVDARGKEVSFLVHRLVRGGYVASAPDRAGFRRSAVLARRFRIVRRRRASGLDAYRLDDAPLARRTAPRR